MSKTEVINFVASNPPEKSCRTTTVIAKALLLANTSVKHSKGETLWLRFRNLGLGVWEVWGIGNGHKREAMIVK